MFLFQISNYDDPVLDAETEELLLQRSEAESRRRCPAMWNTTDRIRAHTAKGPGREKRTVRYRVYGSFLLALGLFALILGLLPPRNPALIVTGSAAILSGLLEFVLSRGRKTPRIPASCKKEAQRLLEKQRSVDYAKAVASICFDDSGVTIRAGEGEESLPCAGIKGAFETEHLWLVVFDDERALLLQRKDLRFGDAGRFLPDIIIKTNTGTDVSG